MPVGRLEVLSIIPGPKNVARLVQRFGQSEYGLVTSLNDSQLPMLRAQIDESSLVTIKSFGEIVKQIHSEITGYRYHVASSRHVLTALSLVCSQIQNESLFHRVAAKPGFHECMFEAFREFGHWGIIGSKNSIILEKLRISPNMAKADELVRIFNDVIAILNKAKTMTISQMIAECLQSEYDADGQSSRILVFMGSTVHPEANNWFKWLVKHGSHVQVILDRHATDGDIFQLSQVIADNLGQAPRSPGEGNRLINNLFAKENHPGADLNWVELHCCGDPLSECEWALRKCLAIDDFANTAILTRDLDRYGPILVHAGESLGVPIETRRRIPLLASGFAKVTLAVLQAVASDDVRELAAPLETSYFGGIEVANLLNTVHESPGKDWDVLSDYLTITEDIEDYVREVLTHIKAFRQSCHESPRDPGKWHGELKLFLESSPWLSNVQDRDVRTQTSLLSNLAQDATIQLIQNPEPLTYAVWLDHATKIWQMSDVSVPSRGDGILLVSSPEELGEVDNLLVLGMLEGSFPRRRSENAILSDELKHGLSSLLEGPPLNDSFDVAKSERDLFYRVCACPSKALYLSYPMSDGESDNVPAFYLEEVKRICHIESAVTHPRRLLTPPADQCEAPRDKILAEKIEHPHLTPISNELTDAKAMDAVRFDSENVQPRSLRSLLECNFKFAAERLLPEQLQVSDHWGWMLEVPRRANLLTLRDARAARAELSRVLTEYLDELRPKLPAWEFDMIYHGAGRLIEGLVEREFISRELWGRNPQNTSLDVRFGDPRLNAERFKYRFVGRVEGITDQDGVRTIHLYRRTPPKDLKEEAVDKYLAEYGMYFAAAWDNVPEVRIEIDGLAEHRTTLLFSEFQRIDKQGDQFLVINLARQFGNKTELAERIKDLLRAPKAIAVSGQMTTRAGDHCAFCSYADLCRQSLGSSDDPFDFGVKTDAQ